MASTRQKQHRAQDTAPPTASKTIDPDRTLVAEAVTIRRPAAELYAFWREQTNLAEVLDNVVSIEPAGENRYRWTVRGPAGAKLSWEAVITHDVPGEQITWQSAEGADIANSGTIEFREMGERGTVVRSVIAYDAPGGKIGAAVAKLFQREPRVQSRRDLHRFKQLMETGEIATGARNRRLRTERDEEQAA